MADDGLSQAELETLLNTVESDAAPTAGGAEPAAASSQRGGSAEPPQKPRDKISPYDFKRPERVTKEQMRALQVLHEGFGRNFGIALSALLRSVVEVKLTSVSQLTCGEFLLSLENPTFFNLLRARPLEGYLILDIDPAILYPIIERLLGGGREPGAVARRPLTEIELRLVSRITGLFLQELRRAWQNVLELELSVDRVESDPRLVQVVPPGEAVALIRFELTINDARGIMSLCIPRLALRRIDDRLSGNAWASHGQRPPSTQTVKQVSESLHQSVVELVAHLAETKITTGDMFNLRVGDIITTEKDVHSPVAVCLEGVPKYRAHPGSFKGHKAIQIEEALGPPPESAKE
ncbi:MAG: flagellar motor switch protein FliM [Planctomycetia bacterium]|nr:flagellar motor switch protein FliM [Planctomycetia bacterium]